MKQFHYDTVSDSLLEILRKCMEADCLNDFVLVGGTSLSLQRGHRVSIDIDLFTEMDYGTMPLNDIKKFFTTNFDYVERLEELDKPSLGYHLYVRSSNGVLIKVDLFYTERFIFPIIEKDGIRLADEREIAAMKMQALASHTKRQKDYWDIYELTEDYTLYDMFKWGLQRNPYSISLEDLKHAFANIKKAENMGEIQSLKGDCWQLIQLDLAEIYKMEENRINLLNVTE